MAERIVAAACKETESGVVYVGARHFDMVMGKHLKQNIAAFYII